MPQSTKSKSRRAEIRRNRPDLGLLWQSLRAPGAMGSLLALLAFWLAASGMSLLRDRVVRYRPGEYVHHDVSARVRFDSHNIERENELKQRARENAPRVYRRVDAPFVELEQKLLRLEPLSRDPRLSGAGVDLLKSILGNSTRVERYTKWIRSYIDGLRAAADGGKLVLLPKEERESYLQVPDRKFLCIQPSNPAAGLLSVEIEDTFTKLSQKAQTELLLPPANAEFAKLRPEIALLAGAELQPTHLLSPELTAEQQNQAAARVRPEVWRIVENTVLVPKNSVVSTDRWKRLAEEQRAYIDHMRSQRRAEYILDHIGMSGVLLLLTAAIAAYALVYQPRIIQNYVRAIGLAGLLAAMLLIAELAGMGTVPILVFGVAPSLLVAMILAIAYDQRFAMGVASLHGLLVTATLGEGVAFYLIIWLGVLTCCFLLDDVRTRSKLVEVGAITGGVMMATTAATGFVAGDPLTTIGQNCLYSGAAAVGVGFVVLGILPFIERTFKITTSMTLLEFADVNQPLLRRLSMEAPGTYNHSLQVATLAEAAAEAIGANGLLCRVGSYYHDIGKVNKSDYFCENQLDGQNRHINLNPSMSLLIILGHVKDGVEMSREYRLPSVLQPLIQEHHGTTLVEYFYHEARRQNDSEEEQVSDVQYRYPGPKPRSRESAIVMIADIVESAARAMVEPTANRIETLVHELTMRRLMDGQFEDSEMTFAELELVEKSMVKTLLGIYHGRLTYPSTAATTNGTGPEKKTA